MGLRREMCDWLCTRVFRKSTFFELRPAFWIYGAVGWLEHTQKIQHYRPINNLGMAIWSFDLFYNVKTAEIGAKIFKINKMAKNHFSRFDLGSQGVVFLGVLGASLVYKTGLRILIRATEVPFLVTPKWSKRGHFGGAKNGTSVARIKILSHFYRPY